MLNEFGKNISLISLQFDFNVLTYLICLSLTYLWRSEWATSQHRDSIASYLGHYSIIDYFAIAEGVSAGRAKFNLLERMHRPCGPPPRKRDLRELGS